MIRPPQNPSLRSKPKENSLPLSPSELRRLIAWCIVSPVVLLTALATLYLWQIGRLLSTTAWVDHADAVIATANNAQKLIIDMETGLRGYLLTKKTEFLEPYDQALPAVPLALSRLQQLVSDNTSQLEKLALIRTEYDEWLHYAQSNDSTGYRG
jgi:CHASE3 domain sensor protein